jgi:uncharacterized protein (DUF1800 family)
MAEQFQIEHLLRRTEFVARPWRVVELSQLSLEAAVDNVLDGHPADPGTVTFTTADEFQRGVELTWYWIDQMAFDSPKPMQEQMGLFWHGHFVTGLMKIEIAEPLRQQIDLFRRSGLGNLRDLTKAMAKQAAMLRYLDNDQNLAVSPNQNFARELMELFLLGVGNYTEADVEAGTAAWAGHTQTGANQYQWRGDWHNCSTAPRTYLGRPIHVSSDPSRHGDETIDIILGEGVVPQGATIAANRGRPTREVAAEFISRKLWRAFAGTEPSAAVLATLRKAAITHDFEIRPWVRRLLLLPEFYTAEVMQGLVAPPMHSMVKMIAATGLRAYGNAPLWWMDGMGQRPLLPLDVSGWGHNVDFVNGSAMARRADAARYLAWTANATYWAGDLKSHLPFEAIPQAEIDYTYDTTIPGNAEALVDRFLAAMGVSLRPHSRQVLVDFARACPWYQRQELVFLTLLTPDLHTT